MTLPLSQEESHRDFLYYAKAERIKFNRNISPMWMQYSAGERVAIEDLLIMYDQMVERLEQVQFIP